MLPRIIEYWKNLAAREQILLAVLGAGVPLWLLLTMVWEPLAEQYAIEKERNQKLHAELAWLQQGAADALSLRVEQQDGPQQRNESQATAAIQAAAARFGLKISRYQPGKKSTIKVWLQKIPFESLARWLHETENGLKINIAQARVQSTKENGIVNAQIDFQY